MTVIYDSEKSAASINNYIYIASQYLDTQVSQGLIDGKDKTLMELFCNHYAAWRAAMDEVRQSGIMIVTPRGFNQKNPALSVADNEADILKKILNEMGLSNKSRKSLGLVETLDDLEDLRRL